jgi:hypothetical protein
LVVGEQQPFVAQPLHQRRELVILELDDFRLPLVDPAAKHHKQELPGSQNEVHESPDAESGLTDQHPGDSAQNQATERENPVSRARRVSAKTAEKTFG